MASFSQNAPPQPGVKAPLVFSSIIIDSGFIIKGLHLSHLAPSAQTFYTVPEIDLEVKDKKARQTLENLPFELIRREPTSRAMIEVARFARLTGDYRSLSVVDLKVLALTYEIDCESTLVANGGVWGRHLRKEPKKSKGEKRMLKEAKEKAKEKAEAEAEAGAGADEVKALPIEAEVKETTTTTVAPVEQPKLKMTWASMAAKPSPADSLSVSSLTVNAPAISEEGIEYIEEESDGSCSDSASDSSSDSESSEDDEETYANAGTDDEYTDDECDVYVLDELELSQRRQGKFKRPLDPDEIIEIEAKRREIEEELSTPFPSLSASRYVEDQVADMLGGYGPARTTDQELLTVDEDKTNASTGLGLSQEDKDRNRRPLEKFGGLSYNSFKAYGGLVNKEGVVIKHVVKGSLPPPKKTFTDDEEGWDSNYKKSHISGSGGGLQSGGDFEDDGEGWVGSANLKSELSGGFMSTLSSKNSSKEQFVSVNNSDGNGNGNGGEFVKKGPQICDRSACATTDFAIQNVLLQMSLKLLSSEGMLIKRTKSWVTRCAACYAVYTKDNEGGRLFCGRCGSDALQRVSASVDGKTGKLRVHLSKNRRENTRGTKFSLPKAGRQNRFKGDLLLSEDQLLSGAWNQKVKKGNTKVSSMFGDDLLDSLGKGGLGDLTKRDDLKVGFGRRNPNSAKGGRERRGSKKKGGVAEEKVNGLRRNF